MDPPDLSDEQAALLNDSIRVVDAGPGSGKTRALVARFMTSATTSKKGVALVSFTNAAVDEVRGRTHQARELLHPPHFVGTIDSFLHRFIVTPAETARLGHLPSYWPSWDDLAENWSTARLRNPAGSGIRLSSFRIDHGGAILLNEPGLGWQETAYLSQVDKAGRRQALMSVAKAMINGLTRHGTYDTSAARVKADQLLASHAGTEILGRISRRFGELLVDEAQDCDEAEIDIIRRIASIGVTTLVVADPDQAIFEFRGSSPKLFLDYRDTHELAARASLTTNYRSTHSICSAVTTLRSAGTISADNQGDCAPVLVLTGGPNDQRAKFMASLVEHGVALEDAIVLAHRRKDAMTVAGSSPAEGTSGAIGNRLAAACSVIRWSENPSERLTAVQAIERIILGLVDWPEHLGTCNQAQLSTPSLFPSPALPLFPTGLLG
jgi:superfamily I DNA/RNA helicase